MPAGGPGHRRRPRPAPGGLGPPTRPHETILGHEVACHARGVDSSVDPRSDDLWPGGDRSRLLPGATPHLAVGDRFRFGSTTFRIAAPERGLPSAEWPLLPLTVEGASGAGRPALALLGAVLPLLIGAMHRALHGRVSRYMFNELWPGFDPGEVPIGSITNGVHGPTWAASQWLELGRELLGGENLGSLSEPETWERLQQIAAVTGG